MAPRPITPILGRAASFMAGTSLQRLIDQKNIGQQGADMDRGVEIVDKLRAQCLLRQNQAKRCPRPARVILQHNDEVGKSLRLRLHNFLQATCEAIERRIRALQEASDRAAVIRVVLPSLSGIGQHQLIGLLDRFNAFGQRQGDTWRGHGYPFKCGHSPAEYALSWRDTLPWSRTNQRFGSWCARKSSREIQPWNMERVIHSFSGRSAK